MVISNRVGKWISHPLSAQTILLHTHVKRSNDRTGRKNFRSSETELRFQETISHCNSLMFTIEIHSDFRSDISQKLAGESFSKFQELFTVGIRQGIEALIGSNPISGSRDVVSTSESMCLATTYHKLLHEIKNHARAVDQELWITNAVTLFTTPINQQSYTSPKQTLYNIMLLAYGMAVWLLDLRGSDKLSDQ